VHRQLGEAEGERVQGPRRGAVIMASWLMIVLAYVIIVVGIFNIVVSDYLLF
jgi:hypothetical protein